MNISEVNIEDIKKGDTVLHDGKIMTVCEKDITYCSFMGKSLFGDSYRLGYKKVKRINKLHTP